MCREGRGVHIGEQSSVASGEGSRVLVAIGCSEQKLLQHWRMELCHCADEGKAGAALEQAVLAGHCNINDVHTCNNTKNRYPLSNINDVRTGSSAGIQPLWIHRERLRDHFNV